MPLARFQGFAIQVLSPPLHIDQHDISTVTLFVVYTLQLLNLIFNQQTIIIIMHTSLYG